MERVVDVIYKDGNIIVHLGKEGFTATKFFVFSRETAKEVRDVLDEFIKHGG